MTFGRWFRDHPRILEFAYRLSLSALNSAAPLIRKIGEGRANRLTARLEHPPKAVLFECGMCGQCTLHATGMTCPMTCPKNIRNGPCGGVRSDGHCEVLPEMKCIWVEAYSRSQRMSLYRPDFDAIQPPLNRRLEGTSAWINLVEGNNALPEITLPVFTTEVEPHEIR